MERWCPWPIIKNPNVYLLQKAKEGLKVEYIGGIHDSSRNANAVKVK